MTTIDNFLPGFSQSSAAVVEVAAPYRSDFELAQKAAAGDMDAFEEVYWKYYRRVFGVCQRMTKNASEAEDLTQQVFIQVFRKIGSFRGDSAFSTWLHRLTVNLVLMHFRRRHWQKEQTTDDGVLPEKALMSGGKKLGGNQVVRRILIDEAINKLPKGYRRIVILHDVCGFEHEEIASMLNCASGTSKSQLFKARRKLRKLLAGEADNVCLQSAL
jgi:RNA polymerase sigma-70 factor (ECF subfamily)